ncbi:hypothetical protein [Moraxella marmotae]|uniref:hypothetical protein n=1 Tax=Moraxella marmotae TaxID=3344520 RepID=UPI0035D46B0C
MTSKHLKNPENLKQDTVQDRFFGTLLTPSEIHDLRQDLKEAYEYAKNHTKKRNLPLGRNKRQDADKT